MIFLVNLLRAHECRIDKGTRFSENYWCCRKHGKSCLVYLKYINYFLQIDKYSLVNKSDGKLFFIMSPQQHFLMAGKCYWYLFSVFIKTDKCFG
jgi:hypothetical protein